MEISKLTISQETRRKLDNNYLSPKKRRQLKIEGVKEYIRSKPVGTPIQLYELIGAAGYITNGSESAGYKAGHQFINKLIKRGTIQRFGTRTHKPSYSVPEDSKTVPQGRPTLQAKVQVVMRDTDDNIPDKPYEVATEGTEDDPSRDKTGNPYSFEITISKRPSSGDSGRIRMGQLEMTDVSIETARTMLENLLENLS